MQELEDNFQMIPIYIDARSVKTVDELIEKYNVKTELKDFLIDNCGELPKGYGLFIVIDDVNSLSDNEKFTHWYK